MNILCTMPFSPIPADFGGALRLFHVLKHLSANHRVSVVTFGRDPKAVEKDLRNEFELDAVRVIPHDPKDKRRVRVRQLLSTFSAHSYHQGVLVNQRFQDAVNDLFRARRFDVLHTEFSHLGPITVPPNVRRVCDSHNVEYDIFERMAETVPSKLRKAHYRLEWFKVRRDEIRWCNQQDTLFTTSDRDREVFIRDGVKIPIVVVPNGVDAEFFKPTEEPVEPQSLVFTGAMHYTPNYDGIDWFCKEVLPKIHAQMPSVKLYVVGKDPPESIRALSTDKVIVTGSVPDVRPYIQRSSVYVVPLRIGGGTRLKVCEAMAMKKPMVSTHVGAEGIGVTDEKTILFADDASKFAQQTLRLLSNESLRNQLAAQAFELMHQQYTWKVVLERMDQVYASMMKAA